MSEPAPSLWSAWTRERDAGAFETLVKPELPHALGFARRLGCNAADAEDALQDALVQLAKVRDDVPIEMGLRAWLCHVVRTRARSRLRSERRRVTRQHAASVGEARAPEPSRAAVREEVEAALAGLSPDEREAVTLRYVHDLEYRDVALVLGLSEAACRQRVHRGIERLRARLGQGAPALLAALPLPTVPGPTALVQTAVAGSTGISMAATAGGLLMASTAGKVLVAGAVLVAVGLGVLVWRETLRPSASGPAGASADALHAGSDAHDPADGTMEASDAREGTARGPTLRSARGIARVGKGALVGRVLDARTSGPLTKAVVLLSGRGLADEAVDVRAETAADGTFRFADVAASRDLMLRVEAPDLAALEQRPVVVRADGVMDLGDLWLGLPGTLVGQVLDPAGAGVAGAEVELQPAARPLRELLRSGGCLQLFENMDCAPEPLALVTTGPGGAFTLPGMKAGPGTLVVRAPGFEQATLDVTLSTEAGNPPVQVRLVPGSVLVGRVVDAAGQGLAGVRLTAYPDAGGSPEPLARSYTESAPDGTFLFQSLKGHGRLALVGTAIGYPNVFTYANAGDTDVRLVMRRGATLDVRIVSDATGAPIVGAQVFAAVGDTMSLDDFVRGTGPGSLVGALTDASGSATIHTRTGELQLVVVHAPGFPPNYWDAAGRSSASGQGLKGPKDLRVTEGHTTVVFRVPSGVRLSGRVLDPDGAPLAGAEVTSPGFLGRGDATLSATDGTYELDVRAADFGAGVTARLHGWVQETAPPPLPEASETNAGPARTRTFDIRMRRAATLTGRVVDAERRGVPGATVIARIEGQEARYAFDPLTQNEGRMPGRFPSGLSKADGMYVLDGVPAGAKVRVLARHRDFVDGWTDTFEIASGTTRAPDVALAAGARFDVVVVDPAGEPVAGARVLIGVERTDGTLPAELDSPLEAAGDAGGRTDLRTGPNGRAQFTLVPPGKVTLRVAARGFAPTGARLTIGAEGGPAEPLRIKLTKGFHASGRVVDPEGRPLEGVQVLVFGMPPRPQDAAAGQAGGGGPKEPAEPEPWSHDYDRNRRAVTDAHGRWSVKDLPWVRLAVQGNKEGFRGDAVPIERSGAAPDLILTPLPPEVVERLAELAREAQGLYGRMSLEGETPALLERLFAVREERQRLYDSK